MRKSFAYCGVRLYTAHTIGSEQVWPKWSGLTTKMRPTGSYRGHAMRKLLSLCCKALCYVGFKISGANGYCLMRDEFVIPVKSFAKITENYRRKNSDA